MCGSGFRRVVPGFPLLRAFPRPLRAGWAAGRRYSLFNCNYELLLLIFPGGRLCAGEWRRGRCSGYYHPVCWPCPVRCPHYGVYPGGSRCVTHRSHHGLGARPGRGCSGGGQLSMASFCSWPGPSPPLPPPVLFSSRSASSAPCSSFFCSGFGWLPAGLQTLPPLSLNTHDHNGDRIRSAVVLLSWY